MSRYKEVSLDGTRWGIDRDPLAVGDGTESQNPTEFGGNLVLARSSGSIHPAACPKTAGHVAPRIARTLSWTAGRATGGHPRSEQI